LTTLKGIIRSLILCRHYETNLNDVKTQDCLSFRKTTTKVYDQALHNGGSLNETDGSILFGCKVTTSTRVVTLGITKLQIASRTFVPKLLETLHEIKPQARKDFDQVAQSVPGAITHSAIFCKVA
jgi:hypothetical protein